MAQSSVQLAKHIPNPFNPGFLEFFVYCNFTDVLPVITRAGFCPQGLVDISPCNGQGVFCSGFNQYTNSYVPGVCYSGSCCALPNPQKCLFNQGISTPIQCSTNNNNGNTNNGNNANTCPSATICDPNINYCCIHQSKVNGECPNNAFNAGYCSQQNAQCFVQGTTTNLQGQCFNNFVCCVTENNNCPSGSVNSGQQCQGNGNNCNVNGQNGVCQNSVCCVWQQSNNQCPSGSTPSGQQCQGNGNQCYSNGQNGVCQNGQCCLWQQNSQCPSGSTPSGQQCQGNGNQCNANGQNGVCQNEQCCLWQQNNQCPTGSIPSGQQCQFNGNQCYFSGQNGICQSGQCCLWQNSNSQCPSGSTPSGQQCQFNGNQCYSNGQNGVCQNGQCCLWQQNSQCPSGSTPSGQQCQGNGNQCNVNGQNGVCQNNQCCLWQQGNNQCPAGSRSSGQQCQVNGNVCYFNSQNGICQHNQCCVWTRQGDGQTCSAGGNVINQNYNCNNDNECKNFNQYGYCDKNINKCCAIAYGQCQQNERNTGSCTNGQSCGGGSICRNGVCCSYTCQNGYTFSGQACSANSQCQVTSSTQIAVCENQHCCLSTNPQPGQQCPAGTVINYNQRCFDSNQCYNPNRLQNICVNNYCCASQPGADVCARYGMVPTGDTCNGNNQVCPSRTQTTATCRDGYCCSINNNNNVGLGYCYNGEAAKGACRSRNDCSSNQACVSGMCCTRTGNEWKYACAGLTAVASCTQEGYCASQMACTTSNYCCECQYGQSSGSCTHGCPPNYTCGANGYCCPSCNNNAQPVGSCFEGKCGNNYRCQPGNICCPA